MATREDIRKSARLSVSKCEQHPSGYDTASSQNVDAGEKNQNKTDDKLS